MKIAIHESANSFFEPWIAYCKLNKITYKIVNCYADDIISQLADCDAVLWHHNHANPKDVLFAKELLSSLELSGKLVFPNYRTGWHFDDKLAQKYLFEATGVNHVKSYVFFDKTSALKWAQTTDFPKVFKLRRGAGSRNVWLIDSKRTAFQAIKQAFGKGYRQYDPWGGIHENLRKLRVKRTTSIEVLKAIAHLVYPIQLEKSLGRERGYVYFQDFIPNNTYDIRVIVIRDKAFAIKRHVRKNDFRASGSGFIEYDRTLFDESLIATSFSNAKKIKSDCAAFDYVFLDGKPLVVEVSYGFSKKGYYDCPGYWTEDLRWHEGSFNPYGWMIENILLHA